MSRIVVANKYKCARVGGKYSTTNKTLDREGLKVEESYVEEMNERTEEHGVFFVIDEEATEQRLKDLEAKGKQIAPASTAGRSQEEPTVTKNDIMAKLKQLGVEFNPADKKDVLATLLDEAIKEKGE